MPLAIHAHRHARDPNSTEIRRKLHQHRSIHINSNISADLRKNDRHPEKAESGQHAARNPGNDSLLHETPRSPRHARLGFEKCI